MLGPWRISLIKEWYILECKWIPRETELNVLQLHKCQSIQIWVLNILKYLWNKLAVRFQVDWLEFVCSVWEEEVPLSRFVYIPLHNTFVSFTQKVSPRRSPPRHSYTVINTFTFRLPPGLGRSIGLTLQMGRQCTEYGLRGNPHGE